MPHEDRPKMNPNKIKFHVKFLEGEGKMTNKVAEKNRSSEKLSILILFALCGTPFVILMVPRFIKDPVTSIGSLFIFLLLIILPIICLELRFRSCFKSKTADKLIKVYLYWGTRMYFNEEFYIYSKALIHTFYGEYENAQTSLDRVDWDSLPRDFQAKKYCIEALIQYLKPGDYSEGIALAERAALSGGFINRRLYKTIYVNIGYILTNENIDQKIMTELENAFKRSFVFHKLLIAWALSNGFKKAGMDEKAMKYEMFCKRVAPYCFPLHQLVKFD